MKLYYWRKIYIIYIYHRLEEITPLVTGVKSYICIYHRLEEMLISNASKVFIAHMSYKHICL